MIINAYARNREDLAARCRRCELSAMQTQLVLRIYDGYCKTESTREAKRRTLTVIEAWRKP